MTRASFIIDKKQVACQSESAPRGLQTDVKFWEKKWWKNLNSQCLLCQRDCKQSAMAKILCCPQYQKMEDKNE